MVSLRVHRLDRRGFTLAEVLVVIAIIGALGVTAVPTLLSYWRAATLKAAAEELATGLNRGRQLAISRNQSVCVEVLGIQYRYRLINCAGAIWTGLGTGANGFFTLANNVTLVTNANPVFDRLGAAAPAATFTVTNPADGNTKNVVLSASGRVQIQ